MKVIPRCYIHLRGRELFADVKQKHGFDMSNRFKGEVAKVTIPSDFDWEHLSFCEEIFYHYPMENYGLRPGDFIYIDL